MVVVVLLDLVVGGADRSTLNRFDLFLGGWWWW